VVSDHGRFGTGRGEAGRRAAAGRGLGLAEYGSGTVPLVLLHGWPQTSHAWRHVVPLLAPDCRTLACDLPGIGSSDPAGGPFDKWSVSGDLHAALARRGVRRPLLAGHGMGAQVAYAYLRRYPAQVHGVMVLDTPIAGVGGSEDLVTSAAFWHVGFHQATSGGPDHMCGRAGQHPSRYRRSCLASPERVRDRGHPSGQAGVCATPGEVESRSGSRSDRP
jgi:pimeloyl-ACP methyl ester carboxylesterase